MVRMFCCFCTLGVSTASMNALHEAVGTGDDAGLKRLLAAGGAGLNERGEGGQSPLMMAVLSGNMNAVKLLLAGGADVTVAEQDGYTPMHGAAFQGRTAIVRLLKAHGLDPSDRHADGFTPLHRASWGAEQRHTDTVRALLQAGAAVDERTASGERAVDLTPNAATRTLLEEWNKSPGAAPNEDQPKDGSAPPEQAPTPTDAAPPASEPPPNMKPGASKHGAAESKSDVAGSTTESKLASAFMLRALGERSLQCSACFTLAEMLTDKKHGAASRHTHREPRRRPDTLPIIALPACSLVRSLA
jgi:hypothetical protein